MSCASLSKSQMAAVNGFGKAVKSYTDYPGVVVQNAAKLEWESEQFIFNPYNNSSYKKAAGANGYNKLITAVVNKHKVYHKNLELAKEIDLSLAVVKGYADALALLSSDSFSESYQKEFSGFTDNLDSLVSVYNTNLSEGDKIPALGNAVSQLLMAPGKMFIKHKQSQAVQTYINKGKPLIDRTTNTIINFMQGPLTERLKADDALLEHNYNMYLIALDSASSNNISPAEFLLSHQYFNRLLENLKSTQQLSDQIVASAKELRKSHTSLAEAINQKQKLTEHAATVRAFYTSFNNLRKTISAL
jgi:hypothetical protein